nr:hypothetical protein [Tanacetum cinerariifolium]
MDDSGVQNSVLKSSSSGVTGLVSKVRNIEGSLRMPMRSVMFTKPLNVKGDAVNETSLGNKLHATKEKDLVQPNMKLSFASVVNEQPVKKAIKIKELRNELYVDGATVTIPIEAVEAANAREGMESVMENGLWLIRRVPLILNKWTPNTILKKDEIKRDNGGTYDNIDHVANNSDSEDVDEYITIEEGTKSGSQESSNDQGASTPFEGLASKVCNIEGSLRMPMRSVMFTKPLNVKGDDINETSLGNKPHATKEKDPVQPNMKLSFASVVNEQPVKKAIKIKELRNELYVDGATVTIPIEAVEAANAREGMESVMENGPWLIRRVPLILNEWTPNTILKKDEIKRVPVWVKMHHVPILAYSDIRLRKRGLRQGDPLSPYLFTLVIEVFTLMLHRRVRESSNFTYHRYCSELELINLCFANDLFFFAHGDVNSASIIKEALDGFKDASGLNPSMPKSKAYFCNVINHTKLAILHVLPFEEDRLPVKYLGIPLVSSRLIFRDCKELIDKASVFVIPSCVLLDIEQIMRGFLWCQGSMNKGKAKVAW